MRVLSGRWAQAGAVFGRKPKLTEIADGELLPVLAAVRHLARAVPAGDDLLCRVLGDFKMYMDARDTGLTPHLAMDGHWEMSLTRHLLRVLKPGMRVADVGANVGYFTLLMASRVGPSGRVLAFEPNPHAARRLKRNINVNGFSDRVSLFECALGSTDDEVVPLSFDPEFLGGGSVGIASDARSQIVEVSRRRLDALCGADDLDLVKIDAEGAEPDIWRGMTKLLNGTRLRTVIAEWQPSQPHEAEASLKIYQEAGFTPALIAERDGVAPITPQALAATPPGQMRMLLLRR